MDAHACEKEEAAEGQHARGAAARDASLEKNSTPKNRKKTAG